MEPNNDGTIKADNAGPSRRRLLQVAGASAIGGIGFSELGSLFDVQSAGATGVTSLPVTDVTAYGADPTGTSDSASSINSAIAALPASGGIVYFPVGIYLIKSTINIGNGSASQISSTSGIQLLGAGIGHFGFDLGYSSRPGVILRWGGTAANGTMVQINGPLKGWAIQNIGFDGNTGFVRTGLSLMSAGFGDCRNLSFQNCITSIAMNTVTSTGYSTNTWHNRFVNISVAVPNAYLAIGISLDGSSSVSNSCYNLFENTEIFFPTAIGIAVVGLYWDWCDNNRWIHTLFWNTSPSSGTAFCLYVDYRSSSGKPVDNCLDGVDFGSTSATISSAGSGPPSGYSNRIVNISSGNGRPSNPGISGLDWGYTAVGNNGA